MGLEMILLLAGSGLGIAVLGLVAYRTVPNKAAPLKVETEKTLPSTTKPVEVQTVSETEPVPEAPPPFSEDSASASSKSIAAPTDTSAIGSASPFVAISLPKVASRTTTRARRKRKTVKAKTIAPDLTGVLPSLNPPDKKEPSAA